MLTQGVLVLRHQGAQRAQREHRDTDARGRVCVLHVCVCALFNKVKRRGLVEQSKHVSGEEGREAH